MTVLVIAFISMRTSFFADDNRSDPGGDLPWLLVTHLGGHPYVVTLKHRHSACSHIVKLVIAVEQGAMWITMAIAVNICWNVKINITII